MLIYILKTSMNYRTKPCERCWKPIKNIWGAKYCLACRKERDDEIYKEQHEKEKLERLKKRVE